MATLYVSDCAKMPSDMNCDLKITGSDKAAVVDASYQHAISSVHKHSAGEPGLKESIENGIETQEV